MKYFFSILLIFIILYMFYIPAAYLKYSREEEAEFSGLLLSKAVDYAGEAAMTACVETIDLEMTYDEIDYMVLSPDNASNVFASVLCLSYGLPATQQNIDSIITKIPVMALAVNDGYYIAEWHDTNDGMELAWKPKKSYIIDTNPDNQDSGTCYGVELNMQKVHVVNKQNLSVTTLDSYAGLPFNEEVMLQYVNRCINKDVNAVLARYAINWNKDSVQNFYLPFSTGTTGVRRIEKPGLIIVIQDMDIDGIRPRNLSVVNGMRVTESKKVVAWTDGSGNKYYCYSGKADNTVQGYISSNGIIFNTIQEAAKAGYLPYF